MSDNHAKSKSGTLIQNLGALTIASFATRLLSFFLTPLYTACLTTAEYGISDIIGNSISLLIPVLTLDIANGVMRFALDKQSSQSDVLRIGIKYCFYSCLVVFSIVLINNNFVIFAHIKQYWLYFTLLYVLRSSETIISYFIRGLNKMKEIAVGGVISSATTIALNVLFLAVLEFGIDGYFLAHLCGIAVTLLFYVFRVRIWQYFTFEYVDKVLEKEMVSYSVPLIANNVSWWINSVSDRYIITAYCGLSENGIYSVASKLPALLDVIQSIFNQAWTLSAINEYSPEDNDDTSGFFGHVYNIYFTALVLTTSFLICSDRLLSRFLFSNDFYRAWKYGPFLLIAIFLGAMCGYIGAIFVAVKNSKIFAKTTVIGAVINTVLNFLLIPYFGAMGAAIATTISYIIIFIARIVKMKQYLRIKRSLVRDWLSITLLVIQSSLLLIFQEDSVSFYCLEYSTFLFVVIIRIKEIKELFVIGLQKIQSWRR